MAGLKKSEAVYIAGFVKPMVQSITALRRNDFNGFILTHSGGTSLPRTMPGVDNIYLPSTIIYDSDYLPAQKARKSYEAKYKDSLAFQAANGYDFIKILNSVMDQKDISRDSVREALEGSFSYTSIFGQIYKKEGKHNINIPLYPAKIVKGKIEYLD